MEDRPKKRTIYILCVILSICAVSLFGMIPLVLMVNTVEQWYIGWGILFGIGWIVGTCIYNGLDKREMK